MSDHVAGKEWYASFLERHCDCLRDSTSMLNNLPTPTTGASPSEKILNKRNLFEEKENLRKKVTQQPRKGK